MSTKFKGKPADWNSTFHDLQLYFGVKEFLVITPRSASGVVLDAPEASKLLSVVAVALSNCSRHYSFYEYVDTMAREVHRGPTYVEGVEATLLVGKFLNLILGMENEALKHHLKSLAQEISGIWRS
ncbi:unnamed protein product [Lupinus luteus]|uniref:Uncharacterized protein n=1 Tax=Lupinus luteus TaxID=3873 RepID=A0AAV1WKD4_LUPLU